MAEFTAFDFAVILVVLLSTVLAFMKGFTNVALSLAAWAGALLVTIIGFAPISPYVRDILDPVELADILTLAGLFIGSLILFKLIAEAVGNAVKSSFVGFLDRSLGALFGLLRGLIIVSVVYLGLAALLGNDQPDWVQKAKTRSLVAWGAAMVESFAGKTLGHTEQQNKLDFLNHGLDKTKSTTQKALTETKQTFRKIVKDEIANEATRYTKEAQEKLDALIEEKTKEKPENDSR